MVMHVREREAFALLVQENKSLLARLRSSEQERERLEDAIASLVAESRKALYTGVPVEERLQMLRSFAELVRSHA